MLLPRMLANSPRVPEGFKSELGILGSHLLMAF